MIAGSQNTGGKDRRRYKETQGLSRCLFCSAGGLCRRCFAGPYVAPRGTFSTIARFLYKCDLVLEGDRLKGPVTIVTADGQTVAAKVDFSRLKGTLQAASR